MDADSMSMLSRMQQRVLSWDYFTLGSDEEAAHAAQLRPLPTTFANFQARAAALSRRRHRSLPPRLAPSLLAPAGSAFAQLHLQAAAYPPHPSALPTPIASSNHLAKHLFLQEYVEAFEPLILEECTAQILRGEARRARPPCAFSLSPATRRLLRVIGRGGIESLGTSDRSSPRGEAPAVSSGAASA